MECLTGTHLGFPGCLRDVGDSNVDLRHRGRLLFCTQLNLSGCLGGRTHKADDLLEGDGHFRELLCARLNGFGAALGCHDGRIDGGSNIIDEAPDFLCGTPDPVRKFTYFVGDHRKTLAILASTSRFDGGVDGQYVGLFGQFIDDLENASNLLGLLSQVEHVGHDQINLSFDAYD